MMRFNEGLGKRHMRYPLVAFALVAAMLAGCDKVPLTSPTGSTISIAVDKAIVPVNGQATVTATVIESAGTAVHNGTVVTFMATAGSFTPSDVTTVNGRAVATYIAPSVSVSAVLNAMSGAASTASGTGSGVTVLVGSAAIGTGGVSINVAPATVPPNGGTVIVTARALDAANNPLAGVAVLFSTDQGTLESTSVVTDVSGAASSRLTTNRVTKVTATVGAQFKEFTVNVVTAPTVAIVSNTQTPTVGSPVSFTVTPSSAATSNPLQSVVVDFGDGQTRNLGPITGATGVTHTYNRADGYTVTATSTDINGVQGVSSTAIVVGFESLPTITMTVTQGAAPNDRIFSVTVAAGAGGAPIRSVRVTLQDGTVIYNGTGGGGFSYRFSGGGSYTITGTVTDATGRQGVTSTTIFVQ